jgi:hypothetical protein
MKRIIISTLIVVALAATASVYLAGVAAAHHPDVSAATGCQDGAPTITVAGTAWQGGTPESRTNNNVQVIVDDVPVGAYAFNPANGFTFTTPPIPAVAGVRTVTLIAVPSWGPNEDIGEPGATRSVDVTVTDDCTTTTTTTSTTTTATTTTAPTATVTTTTVPVCAHDDDGTTPGTEPCPFDVPPVTEMPPSRIITDTPEFAG